MEGGTPFVVLKGKLPVYYLFDWKGHIGMFCPLHKAGSVMVWRRIWVEGEAYGMEKTMARGAAAEGVN